MTTVADTGIDEDDMVCGFVRPAKVKLHHQQTNEEGIELRRTELDNV